MGSIVDFPETLQERLARELSDVGEACESARLALEDCRRRRDMKVAEALRHGMSERLVARCLGSDSRKVVNNVRRKLRI